MIGPVAPRALWRSRSSKVFPKKLVLVKGREDGRIVEDGTHDSLIDLGGEYARLHAEQSRWYER